jgi:hypothetical protein
MREEGMSAPPISDDALRLLLYTVSGRRYGSFEATTH